jgi:aromatic ring-cleaving dioxygenase
MAPAPVDPARITDYHIHVYYDADSRERAALLREWVETQFAVKMGRWRDEPVGPHTQAMYLFSFTPDVFPTVVPFVMMNRMGLTVLLHPESGRPRDDHTINATWMGAVLPVNVDKLPEAN